MYGATNHTITCRIHTIIPRYTTCATVLCGCSPKRSRGFAAVANAKRSARQHLPWLRLKANSVLAQFSCTLTISCRETNILQQKPPSTRWAPSRSRLHSIHINTTTLLPVASLYKSNGTSKVHYYNISWHVWGLHIKSHATQDWNSRSPWRHSLNARFQLFCTSHILKLFITLFFFFGSLTNLVNV